jgi:hypothetical protein
MLELRPPTELVMYRITASALAARSLESIKGCDQKGAESSPAHNSEISSPYQRTIPLVLFRAKPPRSKCSSTSKTIKIYEPSSVTSLRSLHQSLGSILDRSSVLSYHTDLPLLEVSGYVLSNSVCSSDVATRCILSHHG